MSAFTPVWHRYKVGLKTHNKDEDAHVLYTLRYSNTPHARAPFVLSPYCVLLQVAESFNTGDPFQQAPVQVPHVEEKIMSLQKPPKSIRKPVGASFAVSYSPRWNLDITRPSTLGRLIRFFGSLGLDFNVSSRILQSTSWNKKGLML